MEKLEDIETRERNKSDTMNPMNKRNLSMPDNLANYSYPNIMDLQHFIYNNEFPNFQMLGANLDLKDQKDLDLTMYLFKEFNDNLHKNK